MHLIGTRWRKMRTGKVVEVVDERRADSGSGRVLVVETPTGKRKDIPMGALLREYVSAEAG